MAIWINHRLGTVGQREVRRVFRNRMGDWCAEVVVNGRMQIEVLDYHPSVALMRLLRNEGAQVDDGVLNQGAEGEDMRQPARRTEG